MESVIVLRRGLRSLVNSLSYTTHLNFARNCEGSKFDFHSSHKLPWASKSCSPIAEFLHVNMHW